MFSVSHVHPFPLVSILVPRCDVGDDWWYYGDRCQHRGSNSDKTTLALASSLSVLAVMLVVTVVSVICVKKKYKKRTNNNNNDAVILNSHAS